MGTAASPGKPCALLAGSLQSDVDLHLTGAGHGVVFRPSAGVVETVVARQVPGCPQGKEERLVRCHVSLVKHCLARNWDFCSEYLVSRLHQDVWTLRQWKARGWWKELLPRGRSRAPLIPRTPVQRGVLELFPPEPDGAERVAHRETPSADPCISWCEMRRPCRTPCQTAGGMRREGVPEGSRCAERDRRDGKEKVGPRRP